MRFQQRGFSAVEVVITIVVLAGLILGGWTLWEGQQNNQNESSDVQRIENTKQEDNDTNNGTTPIQEYENERFIVKLPKDWEFKKAKGDLSNQENEVYEFENGGLYFTVRLVQYGRGVASDLSWRYTPVHKGDQVDLKLVSTPTEICKEDEPFCSAGDGTLSIFAKARDDVDSDKKVSFPSSRNGSTLTFSAGNKKKEVVKEPEIKQFKSLLNNITFKNQ